MLVTYNLNAKDQNESLPTFKLQIIPRFL